MWWECVWETGGDRKSPPLSSRRPSQITWVDLIAAVTQGDDNTHSGPDPPENTLLLRIIRLYCICSAAAVWTTKWARWDSGWTDRLRICPDYAVIGSQADRHGGNPAEGNTSRGGRQRDSNQRQEGISVSRLVRSTSFLTNRETATNTSSSATFGFLTTNLQSLIHLLLQISQSNVYVSWLKCTDLLFFAVTLHKKHCPKCSNQRNPHHLYKTRRRHYFRLWFRPYWSLWETHEDTHSNSNICRVTPQRATTNPRVTSPAKVIIKLLAWLID